MESSKAKSAAAVVAMLAALAGARASADDVHCPPHLDAVTIDGNVLIVAACELRGTTVEGNVHLYTGGSLLATDASIDGNIQAENAFEVDVFGSWIGGNIQLDGLVGDSVRIAENRVGGNVQLESNRAFIEVEGNEVDEDVQAFENSGGIDILGNTIGGNLQCKTNSPFPTGEQNVVEGNKEDQCAALAPASGVGDDPEQPGGDDDSGGLGGGDDANSGRLGGGGGGAADHWLLLLMSLLLAARRTAPGGRGR